MDYKRIQKEYRELGAGFAVKFESINDMYKEINNIMNFYMSQSIKNNTASGNSLNNGIKKSTINKTGVSGSLPEEINYEDVYKGIRGINKLKKMTKSLDLFKVAYENFALGIRCLGDNTPQKETG